MISTLCVIGYSQNNLLLKVVRCNDSLNNDAFGFSKTILYRNDVIFHIDSSATSNKYYNDIPGGKYKVKYQTFFSSEMSNEITIPDKKADWPFFEIQVCIDQISRDIFNKPQNLFLSKIRNGEKILIECFYSGCFSSGSDSIVVIKNNDKLYLAYGKKKRKAKRKDLNYLINFETEIRNLLPVDFFSTANSRTKITYNGEIFEFDEPSGFWGGFDYLKKKLKF